MINFILRSPLSWVLALAAVGACAVVEQGAIVNMGAIADHDCVVGACAHLAPGADGRPAGILESKVEIMHIGYGIGHQ